MGHLDQRESTSAFVGGGFEVDLLGSVSHVFHYWLHRIGFVTDHPAESCPARAPPSLLLYDLRLPAY